ncbi:hypothetical protein ACQY0O_000800 [Thecaphora frezii]
MLRPLQIATLLLILALARTTATAPHHRQARNTRPAPHDAQVPYTFYQLELQDQLVKNQAAIKGKPYERFFDPELYVYPEMIAPGRKPIDCQTQAMKPDLSDINTLLVPAETTLPIENGWCAYPSGAGYVASRTHFPGGTGDMASWWMWWHSAESERYTLWHPWAHISVSSSYKDKFNDTSLDNTQKLVGSVHQVTENIGDAKESIEIHWFPPEHFKLDTAKLQAAKVVATACGEIYVGPMKAIDMIHLWFEKADGSGLELRSRYFLGSKLNLGGAIPVDPIASPLGAQNLFVGRHLAHNQFHHDQQEFTHLASFLPDIYRAFGNGAK